MSSIYTCLIEKVLKEEKRANYVFDTFKDSEDYLGYMKG